MRLLAGRKAVLFDLDGTLIDSVGVWNEIDDALIDTLGGPKIADIQQRRDALLARFADRPDPYIAYCAQLGALCGSRLPAEEIYRRRYELVGVFLRERVDYKPFADVFVRRLRDSGYTTAIVSATKRSNLEIYRTQNEKIRRKAPIDECFSLALTREDAPRLKPCPDIYLRALALLGLCVWLTVSGPYGEPRRSKPDAAGMTLLFFGVGALLALLTLTTQYSWNGILLPALLAVSLICLVCFYRREKKTAEPMLDVSLLINRRFIIPALTGFFIYGVKCYCCTAVPYYFTQGLHFPSTVSGSWLTVYFLSGFPLSLGLNRLNRRFTTRALAVFGAATWLVSMGMLVLSSADTPLWVLFLSAVIYSVGIAILGGMPNACALKTVPAERSGAASGAISTISNLGAAMISAVLIPLLSVIDSRGGVPDYAASFPKTSLIMLGILAVCFFLSFFFPANKSSGIPETKECDGL